MKNKLSNEIINIIYPFVFCQYLSLFHHHKPFVQYDFYSQPGQSNIKTRVCILDTQEIHFNSSRHFILIIKSCSQLAIELSGGRSLPHEVCIKIYSSCEHQSCRLEEASSPTFQLKQDRLSSQVLKTSKAAVFTCSQGSCQTTAGSK